MNCHIFSSIHLRAFQHPGIRCAREKCNHCHRGGGKAPAEPCGSGHVVNRRVIVGCQAEGTLFRFDGSRGAGFHAALQQLNRCTDFNGRPAQACACADRQLFKIVLVFRQHFNVAAGMHDSRDRLNLFGGSQQGQGCADPGARSEIQAASQQLLLCMVRCRNTDIACRSGQDSGIGPGQNLVVVFQLNAAAGYSDADGRRHGSSRHRLGIPYVGAGIDAADLLAVPGLDRFALSACGQGSTVQKGLDLVVFLNIDIRQSGRRGNGSQGHRTVHGQGFVTEPGFHQHVLSASDRASGGNPDVIFFLHYQRVPAEGKSGEAAGQHQAGQVGCVISGCPDLRVSSGIHLCIAGKVHLRFTAEGIHIEGCAGGRSDRAGKTGGSAQRPRVRVGADISISCAPDRCVLIQNSLRLCAGKVHVHTGGNAKSGSGSLCNR